MRMIHFIHVSWLIPVMRMMNKNDTYESIESYVSLPSAMPVSADGTQK